MPAISPISLAAVSVPQPGSAASRGAKVATSAASSCSSVVIARVSSRMRLSSSRRLWRAWTARCAVSDPQAIQRNPSLSYVASRTIEATIIGVGAISLLSVVTLRDDLAASIGAGGTSLDIAGRTLVAIHDWTFLLGPGFCVGINGILLGWLMYRTGLMPPRLAILGVVGGPLILVSSIAVLFGAYEQDGLHALFSIPEGAFEAAFAIYLIVKGFRVSPILDDARFSGGDGGSLRPAAAP
jgi:hypothetical protein